MWIFSGGKFKPQPGKVSVSTGFKEKQKYSIWTFKFWLCQLISAGTSFKDMCTDCTSILAFGSCGTPLLIPDLTVFHKRLVGLTLCDNNRFASLAERRQLMNEGCWGDVWVFEVLVRDEEHRRASLALCRKTSRKTCFSKRERAVVVSRRPKCKCRVWSACKWCLVSVWRPPWKTNGVYQPL